MKTLIFILIFILTSISITQAQVGWFNQNSGTNTVLFDVCFIDENNGWIAGNTGLIMNTSNGGLNWNVQTAPPNNTYYSIYFVNTQNGWAGGFAGKLIRTTNGGTNWIDGSAGTNRFRYDLYFLNANTGWVVGGDNGTYPTFIPHREIYYTNNSGVSWSTQYAASGESPLFGVHFADNNNGFAVGEAGGVMRTTNGGGLWFLDTTITSYHLRDVFFINPNKGWILGLYLGLPHVPAIFNTNNGGDSWSIQTFGVDETLTSIYFADVMNGWAVGGTSSGCMILHTTNGGVNWAYQSGPTNSALYKVNFVNQNNGWAVGLNGTILKYGDSTTFINTQYSNQNPESIILLQNYPNPFNPSTSIRFDLHKTTHVALTVYNILGEEISTLVNDKLNARSYEVDWDGSGYPSGVYFYKLTTDGFVDVKKMVLMK
ncbi:MAG: T9SS type A sorting domain-containing protein [Ignavibacteria bacterium]|nr:T9SS type A sorting domain-containing protein [Ignavibacteria bacterium]